MIANTPAAWSERARLPESYQSSLWSEYGQRARFDAVLAALDPQPGEKLLDYGCGSGRFSEWMPEGVDYVGYDWALGMVSRAKKTYPERTWVMFNMGWSYDLVACVGPFNLADNWSKQRTWDTLVDLWRHTDRKLAVCLYAGEDPDCLVYDEEEVADFARRQGAKHTVSRHMKNDILLVMHKWATAR